MSNFTLEGLYAITDSVLMPNDNELLGRIEAALRGGTRIVQYRDKSDDAEKRLRQAKALIDLCNQFDVPLLINDDAQLAKMSDAAGVHLGQSDGLLTAARDLLGRDAIIGITCHDSLAFALAGQHAGADYVAYGAFYASKTKPNASPAPLSLLAESKAQIKLPTVAIGGITVDNAAQTLAAGADMLAVVHSLLAAEDVEQQARRFSQLFSSDS
ncbi:thiamine phosphate synthase [Pontibacterium granulatum]|uniref:thiamine phosphate synthase n=1 Tax=Pontibacterium granulatum TaxID=2036029 RepID=UPI00249C5184|nr:thiamine phosphate synthase [Pontibacterium granulatum]MDI3325884.1 thiamine phosphate synthase [Pontibacterium granulatum]